MEKSRSLFQQIIGYKMLFGFFLLFTTCILVDGETLSKKDANTDPEMTGSLNISTPPSLSTNYPILPSISMTPVGSPPDAAISSTPGLSIIPTVHQAASLETTPPVSKQEIIHSLTALNTAAPQDTSTQKPNPTLTLDDAPFSTEEKKHYPEAVVVQESNATHGQKKVSSETTVPSDVDTAVGKKASPPTKDFGRSTQGSFPEPAPSKSTGPRDDKRETTTSDPDTPELTETRETGRHDEPHPFTPVVPLVSQAPESGASTFGTSTSEASSSGKNYTAIVLAVVFSVLLLVGLLAFLYHRRRRHSGSTNFNAPEWAGQVALPDDTGLEKDMEQEGGALGEGETRRGTLVTFFGKRQSRVPSVAMEDLNGKGGKEETEQLLHGEAGRGFTSGGSGDANGKIPEPRTETSEESPPSNMSGGSSS